MIFYNNLHHEKYILLHVIGMYVTGPLDATTQLLIRAMDGKTEQPLSGNAVGEASYLQSVKYAVMWRDCITMPKDLVGVGDRASLRYDSPMFEP